MTEMAPIYECVDYSCVGSSPSPGQGPQDVLTLVLTAEWHLREWHIDAVTSYRTEFLTDGHTVQQEQFTCDFLSGE